MIIIIICMINTRSSTRYSSFIRISYYVHPYIVISIIVVFVAGEKKGCHSMLQQTAV